MKSFTIVSWLSLLLGVAAWAGVVLFWYHIDAKKALRTERLHAMAQFAQQQLNSAHMKALLKETTDSRGSLDTMSSTDILSAVEVIEGSGKPVGIPVHISSATPSSAVAKGTSLHVVIFELDSEGTYSSMLKLTQLLESLPLLTTVDRVELHSENSGGKSDAKTLWHLDARVKLFTSANVTS